jgi:hypothetical protein
MKRTCTSELGAEYGGGLDLDGAARACLNHRTGSLQDSVSEPNLFYSLHGMY